MKPQHQSRLSQGMRLYGTLVLFWCSAVFAILCPQFALGEEATEIDFCSFEIPQWAKQANLSGSLIVQMYVGDAGEMVELKVLRSLTNDKPLVPVESIHKCVDSWRLPNLAAGTRVVAVWYWKHGKGWISLGIHPDNGPALKLRASGMRPSYKPQADSELEDATNGDA